MDETVWPKKHREWVRALPNLLGARKLRLLATAWCRGLLEPALDQAISEEASAVYVKEGVLAALEASDRYADTGKSKKALKEALDHLATLSHAHWPFFSSSALIASLLSEDPARTLNRCAYKMRELHKLSPEKVTAILRRCVGDLQPPGGEAAHIDPGCRNAQVRELARAIYRGRGFERMPEFAAALEHAGCRNEEALEHCRDTQALHQRGCWVLDAVLGEEIAKPPPVDPTKAARRACSLKVSAKKFQAAEDFLRRHSADRDSTLAELLRLADQEAQADHSDEVKAVSEAHPGWSAGQVREYVYFQHLGAGITVERGIARRIVLDSPAELAAHLSLAARFEWLLGAHRVWEGTRISPGIHPDSVERLGPALNVLTAGAAHDFLAVQRFVDTLSPREGEHGYNGMYALLKGDRAVLQKSVAGLRESPPRMHKTTGAVFECLCGLIDGAPRLVAKGLDHLLRTHAREMADSPMLRLVDVQAHGLYELCRRFAPGSVAAFDVSRGVPWDAGYHEWLQSCEDPLAGLKLDFLPPRRRHALRDLTPPNWWDALETGGQP